MQSRMRWIAFVALGVSGSGGGLDCVRLEALVNLWYAGRMNNKRCDVNVNGPLRSPADSDGVAVL